MIESQRFIRFCKIIGLLIVLAFVLVYVKVWGQERVQFPTMPEKQKSEERQSTALSTPEYRVIPFPDIPVQSSAYQAHAPDLNARPFPEIAKESSPWPMTPNYQPQPLPEAPPQMGEVRADRFDGGLNVYTPPDKLAPNQARILVNFLPYADYWLKKREGFQKIMNDYLGIVYGMAITDSLDAQFRLVAAIGDTLYYTNDLYDGTYAKCGEFSAKRTVYFASTPWGLIISNGLDSTRLWNGLDSNSIVPLGICDTGTVDNYYSYGNAALADTFRFIDSTNSYIWTDDYWIGYYLYFTSADSMWEIIDNGDIWIEAINPSCTDTDRTSWTFEIISQPDSATSDLQYPKGKAVAYYKQRLFVSSAWYPQRIWYSAVRLPNEIDIDAIIDLDMSSTDEIVAMRVFNGYLIVIGANSIYAINENLEATLITKGLGSSAPKSIAVGDDYIYFLSQPTAVYRWNGNIYGSLSYKMERISDPIKGVLGDVLPSTLDDACGIYNNNQYWLAISPDTCLVFDERTKGWYKQSFGFTDALPFSGDFRIQDSEILYPSSDISTTWSSTGANAWSVIDDQSNDADYIYGNSKTAKLGFTNLSNYATGAIIRHITIGCRAKKSYPITARIEISLSANDTTYDLADFNLNTDWFTQTIDIEENPASGAAWTSGDIDSLVLSVFGYVEHGHTDYVSGLWVIPSYQSDVPTENFLFATPNREYIYQYGGVFTDDTASNATYIVTGKPIEATYQSGWFNLGNPTHQYQMRKFWVEKDMDHGDVLIEWFTNWEETADYTDSLDLSQDTTELFWLPQAVAGKNFSVKFTTRSNIDTLQLRGWGAVIRDLGERKD